MRRALDLEQATFTPLEAHILTGVSQVTQRDWRRRELLGPKKDKKGWSRFTTGEIASLLILNRLMRRVSGHATWFFSTRARWNVVRLLAQRAHGSKCRVDGKKMEPVARFFAYASHGEGASKSFELDDLSKLPERAREGDNRLGAPAIEVQDKHDRWRTVPLKQRLISYYVVLDLFDIVDELEARKIKPYFVEKPTSGKGS
jgi:hypothetical protein